MKQKILTSEFLDQYISVVKESPLEKLDKLYYTSTVLKKFWIVTLYSTLILITFTGRKNIIF